MFNRSSFSPISFSRTSFGGANQEGLTASSGVRRLQLYQLQEESLIKDAARKAAEKVVEAEAPKPTGKPAKPRKLKPVVSKPQMPERLPSLVLAPVKTLPSTYEELSALPTLAFEQIYWSSNKTGVIISLSNERARRRKKLAAFLLLAA